MSAGLALVNMQVGVARAVHKAEEPLLLQSVLLAHSVVANGMSPFAGMSLDKHQIL